MHALIDGKHTVLTRDEGEATVHGAENASLLRHFILKLVVLPRQAREKHGERALKKEIYAAFSAGDDVLHAVSAMRGGTRCENLMRNTLPSLLFSLRSKTVFLIVSNDDLPIHVRDDRKEN